MTAACKCGAALGRGNASGICKACWLVHLATDPAVAERRRAGMMRYLADPERRATHSARCSAAARDISEDVRESRRRHGHDRVEKLAAGARRMSPEQRAENGRKRTDTMLAWCPPEWRDTYRKLKKSIKPAAEAKAVVLDMIAGKPMPDRSARKAALDWCPQAYRDQYRKLQNSVGAAAARIMILEQVARDERDRLAALSPFERQLERVRAGARLITIPTRPRIEPSMTLGGVSGGML